MENIHPIFDTILSRSDQESLLNQRAKVLWFTGLSGSGKSTLAQALEKKLYSNGYLAKILDGDNVRTGLNNNLGFSLEDRKENIRRIAEVAKLFKETGVVVLCSFVSPTIEIRKLAKEIIGEADFLEVFVNTPLEICEKRDVKGLYKKARNGELKGFTGIDSPYEPPINPYLNLKTANSNVKDLVDQIWKRISKVIINE